MANRSRVLSVLGALAFAMAAVATGTAPAQAQSRTLPLATQPFSVTVDNCRTGYSEGVLGWDLGPSIGGVVRVEGVVVDQVRSACVPATSRYTEATFLAYFGNSVVASRQARADDAVVRIAFDLAATPGIDRMEVRVCLQPTNGTGPRICASKMYLRPNG